MQTVHPSVSTEDAIDMLDSRRRLTHRELKLIVESLWHAAFREGARQGREAGIEYVSAQLLKAAAHADAYPLRDCNDLANVLGKLNADEEPEVHREYKDPGQARRDQLADKARQRDGI